MRRIDELHLDYPFAGSRMLRDLLRGEGVAIGRQHVATLMRRMGIEAIYRRPNTSKPAPGHKIYPYLLRGLTVERPNQVWAMDITYIPMARGFVYLGRRGRLVQPPGSGLAAVDHHGGRVLPRGGRGGARPGTASRRSSTPTRAASSPAPPSPACCWSNAIAISMDGKGSWRDNVFVERLWRSVKYEEVYLRAYDSVAEARASLGRYLDFYNRKRPHSSLERADAGSTPTSTTCRRPRQHEFRRRVSGRHSGRATPSLRDAQRAKSQTDQPGRSPLILRGNLSRQPGPALGGAVAPLEIGWDPRPKKLWNAIGRFEVPHFYTMLILHTYCGPHGSANSVRCSVAARRAHRRDGSAVRYPLRHSAMRRNPRRGWRRNDLRRSPRGRKSDQFLISSGAIACRDPVRRQCRDTIPIDIQSSPWNFQRPRAGAPGANLATSAVPTNARIELKCGPT